jgi:hypothetical protein
MSYTLNASDNSINITITDGSADTSTALTFPGPNSVGYGGFVDQNFLSLLTSFASNAAPSSSNVQGQLWFNKQTQTLNVYTTGGYAPVSGVSISSAQPTNPLPGTIWYNSITKQLFLYNNGAFNLIGPLYTSTQGVSGAVPVQVNDANILNITHNILQMQYGNEIIAVFSSDPAFTPSPAISGFPVIYSGLTINNTVFSNTGQFYSNANAASYIPTDPTILGIETSITNLSGNLQLISTAANTAISAANTAASQAVSSLNNSINTALNSAVTNLQTQSNVIVGQATANLNATIATVQSYANVILANLVSAEANISTLSSITASSIATIQTNITTLQTEVYGNANVATYLPHYNGPVAATTMTATTPAVTDVSTNVATTAFVRSIFPAGMIVMWSGATTNIPTGWQLCNGSNGAPDLRGQFIVGAGGAYAVAATGGATSAAVTAFPAHTHGISLTGATDAGGVHSHTVSINDPGHLHAEGLVLNNFNTQIGLGTLNTYIGNGDNALSGGGSASFGYGGTAFPTSTASTGITGSTAASPSHTHTITLSGTTASTGTTGPTVNTLPPYYALCYIMKL